MNLRASGVTDETERNYRKKDIIDYCAGDIKVYQYILESSE